MQFNLFFFYFVRHGKISRFSCFDFFFRYIYQIICRVKEKVLSKNVKSGNGLSSRYTHSDIVIQTFIEASYTLPIRRSTFICQIIRRVLSFKFEQMSKVMLSVFSSDMYKVVRCGFWLNTRRFNIESFIWYQRNRCMYESSNLISIWALKRFCRNWHLSNLVPIFFGVYHDISELYVTTDFQKIFFVRNRFQVRNALVQIVTEHHSHSTI